ncbi:ribonuclease J [Candidatus Microgenomates bacterium]|nr:ribonuclease J [Candidatus Microgenomates bacterium]
MNQTRPPRPVPRRTSRQVEHVVRRNHQLASQRAGMEASPANRSSFNAQTATVLKTRPQVSGFQTSPTLKFIPLGGLGEVGRNMNILEYGNDAIVIDAGFRLGVDLPGINYALSEFTYLEKIKLKIRGYVFTHGHLDHVGAMPFILPNLPAPCYGSRFTLEMLERLMLDRDVNFKIDKRFIDPDSHEKIKIGPFMIEMVRVTHSIPESCALVIDTPAGKIVHTGDFKFDPTPLDGKQADLTRLRQLGSQNVTLLLSDSTNCERLGRTPTEKLIEPTIKSLISQAPGRVIVSAVSTNINRIQMIINAAIAAGRKVVIDGRSMLANIELSVRHGFVKIPRGTIVAMRDLNKVADKDVAIVSTGHQGEINSVLMRMASGEHKFVKLKPSDTVILSASPIPGNEQAVIAVVDRLLREGTKVFQHTTAELDGTGPLHVSGHGNRDELAEMIKMVRPKYFAPIHGEFHHQVRHGELAIQNGVPKHNVFVLDNGDVLELTPRRVAKNGRVPAGTQLVDQTGEIVPNLVIKDRLLMGEDGMVVAVLTLNGRGQHLTSPDIISRGFIHMKDNGELINQLRQQLRHFTARRFGKFELSRFKQELRDDMMAFLYDRTQRSPIVIPVVNIIGAGRPRQVAKSPPVPTRPPSGRS